MRTLSHLWRSLEAIPGLLAIPAFWEAHCGPDIDLVRPHLRVTDMEGSLYPCPKPHVGYCPRKIIDYGNGEFAAYWAVDAADKPICVVIDFDVFSQKEWKARPVT